jgi:hypothetical protein
VTAFEGFLSFLFVSAAVDATLFGLIIFFIDGSPRRGHSDEEP